VNTNTLIEYEHARQALKTALQRMQTNELYYCKKLSNELTEDGVSDKRYLQIKKRQLCNIAQDLIDELT
jgi:hypothetical protein